MTPDKLSGNRARFFADLMSKSLAEAFSAGTTSPWSVEVTGDKLPEPQDPRRDLALTLSGNLQGQAVLQIRESDIALLAATMRPQSETSAPEGAAEAPGDALRLVEKLMQNVVKLLAPQLEPNLGAVAVQLAIMDAPSKLPDAGTVLKASAANVGTLFLHLVLDEALQASLSSETPAAPSISGGQTGNLTLLLGVELDVRLRFGQRMLPLREILALSPGAVIELDRQVQEPIDVLLGEKEIAKGEVVIVDGKYGVRVSKVTISRESNAGCVP
jgi:flagellar motor switch protein FliN